MKEQKIIEEVKKGNARACYDSRVWRAVRDKIVQRDNHECQMCKEEGRVTTNALLVHHIKHLKDYPELAFEEDNLITVCHDCHEKLHPERFVNWNRRKKKFTTPERW